MSISFAFAIRKTVFPRQYCADYQPVSNQIVQSAFQLDLTHRKLAEQTLTVIYSEFGRRAAENASLGTDHGAAAPVLLVSPALRGGFVGEFPSLANLDDGDQRFTTDFRSLYATLLETWLEIGSASISTMTGPRLRLFKS